VACKGIYGGSAFALIRTEGGKTEDREGQLRIFGTFKVCAVCLPAEAAHVDAGGRFGPVEDLGRRGTFPGEPGPHAYVLAALSGKQPYGLVHIIGS
jgi:hypothetical protein